jgi:GH15 family glucan-1,4-alpha-glucosidase
LSPNDHHHRDYALIGDCETAALVSRDGSIDWLCWPRFDSDACFAALLGTPDNGRWRIAPTEEKFRASRKYRPGTLILETRYETDDGVVRLIDFMPLRNDTSDIVRLVVGESGRVTMCMELVLRFGYGLHRALGHAPARSHAPRRRRPDMVLLTTPVEVHGENFKTVCEFTVSAGETVPFTLIYAPSHLAPPKPTDPNQTLGHNRTILARLTAKFNRDSPFADIVTRSLITLKALTYAPTGGIVAAPTTSLPEWIGGFRNWDYRFCWLPRRDAARCLAFMNAGYYEEAAPGGNGCCAPSPAGPSRRRSCTASAASGASSSGRCRGCRASQLKSGAHRQQARTASSNSTSTAR